MKIETGRFILEELASEAEVKYFAQISRKMAWKDTVELLLNEKKIDAYIRNIAKKDMEAFLAEKEKYADVIMPESLFSDKQRKVSRQRKSFDNLYHNYRLNWFIERAQKKVLQYRRQIVAECKKQFNIDFENDRDAFKKLKKIGVDNVKNENLNPPIPISDWHYNIQFLKPNMREANHHTEKDLWESSVSRYIQTGIDANNAEDRSFYYFKITDKKTGKIVGISRICAKENEFVINYNDKNQPITKICIGDPGLFLDPSCQGAGKGSEIYATTLNVLCNFLLKEEDKSQNIVIKCNTLNRASRRLQYSIGALLTNEHRPIDGRYYFTVSKDDILKSRCLDKLEESGLDTYTITTDEKITYTVSLRKGILQKHKEQTSFIKSVCNMIEKVKLSKAKDSCKKTANVSGISRIQKTY